MLIFLCTATELLLYELILKCSIHNWQDCKQAIFTNKIMNMTFHYIFFFFFFVIFFSLIEDECTAWHECLTSFTKEMKCQKQKTKVENAKKETWYVRLPEKKAKLLRKCQSRNGTSENQNICFGTNLLRHVFLLFVYNENTMTFN